MTERMGEYGDKALTGVDKWTYGHQSTSADLDAASIERHFQRYERFYRALLADRFPSDRDALVLDLPCGEGAMVYTLRRMGYKNVAGYDLDRGRLATGQKLGLPLHYGDIFELLARQPDNSVGGIFAMDFIEHLEKPQVVEFLTGAHRVLAPGGRILLRTPCADSPQGANHVFNDFTHKWGATSGVLRQLLAASGFQHAEAFGEHPTLAMSKGLVRVPLFRAFTTTANALLRAAGLSAYAIWSASVWGAGVKGSPPAAAGARAQ